MSKQADTPSEATIRDRFDAALVGTAYGDALGDPTEFLSSAPSIERVTGAAGARELPERAEFTDDTQMALFSSEAIVLADAAGTRLDTPSGLDELTVAVRDAYLRWYVTQRGASDIGSAGSAGWLLEDERLHRQKAPGLTCLGGIGEQLAARRADEARAPEPASNHSKGCGGVMRAAPFGLAVPAGGGAAGDAAARAAWLSHGHPLGWLSAACYAQIVGALLAAPVGADVASIARRCIDGVAERWAGEVSPATLDDLTGILGRAIDLAGAGAPEGFVCAIPVALGEGWVGDEALAIGLYCALAWTDPADALAASASHGGDTDSTAALTGCLLGLIYGTAAFDGMDVDRIDGIDIVRDMAELLWGVRERQCTAPAPDATDGLPFTRTWWIEPGRVLGGRYPGGETPDEGRVLLAALIDIGIDLVINLQEPGEIGRGGVPFADYRPALAAIASERGRQVDVINVPVLDMGVAAEADVARVLDEIDERLARGHRVYVHCWGGHGRTGTIAGCWLRTRGLTADEAFERIRAAREHEAHLRGYPSPQTRGQRALVESWEVAGVGAK